MRSHNLSVTDYDDIFIPLRLTYNSGMYIDNANNNVGNSAQWIDKFRVDIHVIYQASDIHDTTIYTCRVHNIST